MSALPTVHKQRRILRMQDLICRRCQVEATSSDDHVCQLCRAFGKTLEPVVETGFWEDIRSGIQYAGKYIFGLKS